MRRPGPLRRLAAATFENELGMQVVIGMVVQGRPAGSAWGDRAPYAAAPLRAFGN